MSQLVLYHGSPCIVEVPTYGKGKLYNDYGQGFYCTEYVELAREWACPEEGVDGFANEYVLDLSGLRVLNLSSEPYTELNWLALLLAHRIVNAKTPVAIEGKRFLEENFKPSTDDYDIIIGHRADDSYFTFARAFLRNEISLEQLSRALRLGDLGDQVMLRSKRAFKQISFQGAEAVQGEVYYPRRLARDERARRMYQEEAAAQGIEGLYLRDILRGEGSGIAGL